MSFRKVIAARRAAYRATDKQKTYLVRLLRECFTRRITHGTRLDAHHLDRLSKTEASQAIQQLKNLLGKS
jgi:DNA-binding MarR family transcriptional regulator